VEREAEYDQGNRGHQLEGPPTVRWTGPELIIVLLVAPALWSWLCNELLVASGLFDRVYGPQAVAVLRYPSPHSLPVAATVAAPASLPPPGAPTLAVLACASPVAGMETVPPMREMVFYRTSLWTINLAFLLQVATVLLVLYGVSGTSPAELGLTFRRAGRNMALGLGLALIVTPLVVGLNILVVALWKHLDSSGVQEHPFTRLGQQSLLPVEWVLLVSAAVVVASIWEEVTCRGLLQPWFASQPNGGAVALAIAFIKTLLDCWDRISAALPAGWGPTLVASLPVLALFLLIPVYALIEKRSPGSVGPALFGTAVLWAWLHARVWPTPLALFFLGLVLGWLAYRTRSLVASITLHAAFNGTACALLLFQPRVG
jgi:membrane protease YdiL (CAAX protease family)